MVDVGCLGACRYAKSWRLRHLHGTGTIVMASAALAAAARARSATKLSIANSIANAHDSPTSSNALEVETPGDKSSKNSESDEDDLHLMRTNGKGRALWRFAFLCIGITPLTAGTVAVITFTGANRTSDAMTPSLVPTAGIIEMLHDSSPPPAPSAPPRPPPERFGSCASPMQPSLRFEPIDHSVAEIICCHNHVGAESYGYWHSTGFAAEAEADRHAVDGTLTFYDSTTGRPLFVAPRDRSWRQFLDESTMHGWPSFRDSEVVWESMNSTHGEVVSIDGTHLGHNLADEDGNRYCIDLVCIAGRPTSPPPPPIEVYLGNGCFW